MNREPNLQRTSSTSHIGTAEMSLAMWLRNGRAQKNYSLEDVARITKIQSRILERLEAGRLDGLPAEVFVRGFVRSFARCVGLDEDEALRRYTACVKDGNAKVGPTVAARAVIDAMGDLAPNARLHNAPQILHNEPIEPLAAGSLEMPEAPAVTIEDEPVFAELPVEISFTEVVASAPVEPEPTEASEPSDGTVVAAPPADMDLSAEIALPVTTPAKRKRTKRAATVDGSIPTPKRTRKKVATGTPSEPTPTIAAADSSEQTVDAGEPVAAPKRRRKPRGSVQPISEAAPVEAAPVEAAPVEEIPVDVELTADAAPAAVEPVVDAAPAADEMFGSSSTSSSSSIDASLAQPVHGNQVFDSSQATEVGGEFEARPATDAITDDNSTAKFERFEDEAPVQLPTEAWTPRMPPFAAAFAAPPAWRKSPAQPALVAVIDDADPDGAERALEDRRAGERRRTFLPPILLDRDGDRSGRQGGLTLAVIILLIAATLTLSYLMRRPSAAGDGVTIDEVSAPSHLIG